MAITSHEFDEALNKELDRLTDERIAEYEETESFWERVEAATQKDLDSMRPFFAYSHGRHGRERLTLYLSPPESEAARYVDIEDILNEKITENDTEHLENILKRLEAMVFILRNHLST